jgi:two-component system alkaline phosphatase synthesis response regulator PhoP
MKKIVIVDDEVHIRSLLEQTIENLEYELDIEVDVKQAENGRVGFELISKEVPDLVFLDVMMPLLNGYDLCKMIREKDELQHVVIVMLTAKGQETDKEKGFEHGVNYFMTKPFDPDEVLELAGKILGKEE